MFSIFIHVTHTVSLGYLWYYFDKIKTTQDTLTQLITEHRRNLARENQEREIERDKEIEVQHREEIN